MINEPSSPNFSPGRKRLSQRLGTFATSVDFHVAQLTTAFAAIWEAMGPGDLGLPDYGPTITDLAKTIKYFEDMTGALRARVQAYNSIIVKAIKRER